MKRTLMVVALLSLGILSLPHNSLLGMEAAGAATPEARSHASSIDSGDADCTAMTKAQIAAALAGRSQTQIDKVFEAYASLIEFLNDEQYVERLPGGAASILERIDRLDAGSARIKGFYGTIKTALETPVKLTPAVQKAYSPVDSALLESFLDRVKTTLASRGSEENIRRLVGVPAKK